ncbi:MAG: hypothetical protein SV201_13570 [Pseudomonadota bacterium]|nr:hypothetical protein [Pseudomonadota bacterium]
MKLAGRFAVYLGIILIVLGMIAGFGAMIVNQDSAGIQWLGVVPVGFVVLLAGTVMSQLSRPDDE